MTPRVWGVIPSRYASTRLPAKPLAMIHGKPMVQRVYEAASRALEHVVVATDDTRIVNAVKRFGGKVILTPKNINSGTERMEWVSRKLPAQYYVNIQGDEPMIHPHTIRSALKLAVQNKAIATSATPLKKADMLNPSAVKVIVGARRQAIYFSRAPIPYVAHGVDRPLRALKHLGLYVYPKDQLRQFVKWAPPALEQTEKLEQLRALYYGASIYVAFTTHDSIGVDTLADLKKVSRLLSRT